MKKRFLMGAAALAATATLFACGKSNDEVIIYTNADDEAIEVMQEVLDAKGYSGQYEFQSFGTSELAGRIAAEGTNLEADLVTLSTFYLQDQKDILVPFHTLEHGLYYSDDFHSPILGLEGSLMVNTEVLKAENLPMPHSLKDLADPVYKDEISISNIHASSTAWLLIQAIIDNYGEEEGQKILTGILENTGQRLVDSGSAPVAAVQSGEVAIAFGLRQQGVKAQESGLPIEVIDVTEGNYVLTESVAIVKHDTIKEKAQEIAEVLAGDTREGLQKYYPTSLYEGETTTGRDEKLIKFFPEELNTDLQKKHIEFFDRAQSQVS